MKKIIVSVLILFFQLENSKAQGFLFANVYCDSLGGMIYSIDETNDGNLIAGGYFFYNNQYEIGMLLKLDLNGNVIWQKNFQSIHSSFTVRQTNDNGFIIYGYSDTTINGTTNQQRMNLIKTNAYGDSIWCRKFSGYGDNMNLELTQDGGFIVCCQDTSTTEKILLTKLSSTGSIEWQHFYLGNASAHCHKVIPTYDNGFIVVGHSDFFSSGYLMKTDSLGTVMWDSSFSYFNDIRTLAEIADSTIIVVSASSGTTRINKFNTYGLMILADSIITPNSFYPLGISATNDGGFLISGSTLDTTTKFYCAKFNSQCQFQWSYKYHTPNQSGSYYNVCINGLQSSLNGNYYLVGGTQTILDQYYPTLICLSPWATSTQNLFSSNNSYCTINSTLNGDVEISFPQEENYSLSIFDLSGKLLNQSDGNSTEVKKNFNLSSGVYLLEVKTKEGVTSKLFSVAN